MDGRSRKSSSGGSSSRMMSSPYRTTNLDRIVENLTVFDFELGEDEMAAIQALARPNSRIVNPVGLAPVWDASFDRS